MTFHHRRRGFEQHLAAHPLTSRPSQRELVAWSLLLCPDDGPSRGRR